VCLIYLEFNERLVVLSMRFASNKFKLPLTRYHASIMMAIDEGGCPKVPFKDKARAIGCAPKYSRIDVRFDAWGRFWEKVTCFEFEIYTGYRGSRICGYSSYGSTSRAGL
jgi:hypothetical protein